MAFNIREIDWFVRESVVHPQTGERVVKRNRQVRKDAWAGALADPEDDDQSTVLAMHAGEFETREPASPGVPA